MVGSGQMAQKPPSLFKGKFISFKGKLKEKSGWFLQEEIGWLTGLIDKVLVYNMGHSAHGICWFPGFLLYAWDVTSIHKVLGRGLYLRGHIENRFPFTYFPVWTGQGIPLSLGNCTTAILTIKWPRMVQGGGRDKEEFSMEWPFAEEGQVHWWLFSFRY
jgi:hypothetical protein